MINLSHEASHISFVLCLVYCNSINNFFAPQKMDLYTKDGVPCREVARLIFADFPTSLIVDGLGPTPWGMSPLTSFKI